MLTPKQVQALRDRIGRVGVWAGQIGEAPAAEEHPAIARLEEVGYGAV